MSTVTSVMLTAGRVFNCTVTPFQDYVWLGHSSRDMLVILYRNNCYGMIIQVYWRCFWVGQCVEHGASKQY